MNFMGYGVISMSPLISMKHTVGGTGYLQKEPVVKGLKSWHFVAPKVHVLHGPQIGIYS